MWSELTEVGGVTNTVTLPADGIVSIPIPIGVEVCAYINGVDAPLHHLHVKAGDTLSFKVKNSTGAEVSIPIEYGGSIHNLKVKPTDITIPEQPTIPVLTEVVEEPIVINQTEEVSEPDLPITYLNEEIMASTIPEVTNIFKPVVPAAVAPMMGDGYGAGGLAAMIPLLALSGALGGRRVDGDGCDASKVAVMNAGFDGLNHNINTSTVGLNHNINTSMMGLTNQLNTGFGGQRDLSVMQKLGNIEGDIWKAEGQVQLALAQSQSDINNRIADSTLTTVGGQSAIRKDVSDAIAASLASQSIIRQEVATAAAVNQATTLNAKYELSQNIRDDGDKTRALIVRQYEDTLNRQLAVAQDALLEQRSFARQREVEVNVTQNVNQNQAQLQAQAQQQQQFQVTNNLLQAILCQAQVAQATNQNLIIGNTGAVASGPQTANPVNVRA